MIDWSKVKTLRSLTLTVGGYTFTGPEPDEWVDDGLRLVEQECTPLSLDLCRLVRTSPVRPGGRSP